MEYGEKESTAAMPLALHRHIHVQLLGLYLHHICYKAQSNLYQTLSSLLSSYK